MWPRAALDHAARTSSAGEQHRRAQVDVERAVDLLDGERLDRGRWPGSAALATRTSTGAGVLRPAASTRVAVGEVARRARAPPSLGGQRLEHVGAAAGEHQRARRGARARGRSPARARRVAPVTSTRPCRRGSCDRARMPRRRAPTVAVKPCRNVSPPTGPISPAAKNPAAGAPASSSATGAASWSASPNMPAAAAVAGEHAARRPAGARRARAAQRRAPRAGRGRRTRRRGRAGARPGRGGPSAPTATAPVRGSAPISAAHEEVALHVVGLVRRRPRCPSSSPPATSVAVLGAASASIASRSFSSAGLPASSRMTLPSAAVIVSSGPTGAAPCETHGSTLDAVEAHADRAAVDHLSPRNSAAAPSAIARRGQPAEHRHGGRARDRTRSTRVGREGRAGRRAGSRRRRPRGRACRRARRCRPRPARRRRGRRVAAPPPSDAAQTATRGAVLDLAAVAEHAARRRSRRAAPARAPRGRASSVASGAARCAPEAKTTRDVAAARRRARRAAAARRLERARARRRGRRTGRSPMRTAMRVDDTPRCRPAHRRALRPDRRRQDGGGARARRRACAPRRGPGRGLRRRAAGLPRASRSLTGAADAGERARLEHRLVVVPRRRRETFSAGELRAARARGDRRAAAPAGGGRSSSAAPACTCAPRSPSSTCARRRTRALRERWTRRARRRTAPQALHARARAARARRPPRHRRRRDAHRIVRALELLDAGPSRRRADGEPAVDARDAPPDAARRR